MIMLDSIIRAMALTKIDADDRTASVFSRRAVPTVARNPLLQQAGPRAKHCTCQALSLGQNWTLSHSFTPLWIQTPAWDDSWTDVETRKDESRRLCWSALSLAAAHTAHAAAFSQAPLDFYIIQPSNVSKLSNRCVGLSHILRSTLCCSLARRWPNHLGLTRHTISKSRSGLCTRGRCSCGIVVCACAAMPLATPRKHALL